MASDSLFYRLRLRHLLILILLVAGILPLAVNSFFLIRQNRDLLEVQEMGSLTRSARLLSVELDSYLVTTRSVLEQLGNSVVAVGAADTTDAAASLEAKLRQPWVGELARRFLAGHPELATIRALNPLGIGPQYTTSTLSPEAGAALNEAFAAAGSGGEVVYRFIAGSAQGPPQVVVAIPVTPEAGGETLVVEGVLALTPLAEFSRREVQDGVALFLIQRPDQVLWSVGSSPAMERALVASDLMERFVDVPLAQAGQYELTVDGSTTRMLSRVSPVDEPDWGVVVQKPAASAFAAVRDMVFKTVLTSAVLVGLALIVTLLVARTVSRPIQELSRASHEIAEGSFGQRVEIPPVGAEIGALAEDFNRMSRHVQTSIERLREAAQENQELFIGSMRAFIAAVDAKDPYTRGHSERVAAHSRTIARHMGLDAEAQHRVWVGALLHDVGKIGVEDRVLMKDGVLTSEEYEEMKKHPVIGAEIMSRIEQLRDMIPAIRWHHESWNGKGYPDGLEKERIPLPARIVAVADTFDAITTNRPYQKAYQPAFAVEKVRELVGKRFDARVVSAFLRAFEAGEIQLREQAAAPRPASAVAS